jgi:predicted HTH transcriptional regulator
MKRPLITNKLKPIPQFVIEHARVSGEPVVVVSVEARMGALYSTHDNQIFVRRGATNRRPDPNEVGQTSGGL